MNSFENAKIYISMHFKIFVNL